MERCLICGADASTEPATVNPFVASRIWWKKTSLHRCTSCGFSFYDRPPQEILSLLYKGYATGDYKGDRASFEPSYKAIADNITKHTPYMLEVRRAYMASRIGWEGVTSCLDFGGEGSHIPTSVEKRFAFNVSGADPVSGVLPWDGSPVDLVTCTHVLEHVADPVKVVEFLKTAGSVYVEVPVEQPSGEMHEHINLFTADSLAILLPDVDVVVQDWGWTQMTVASGIWRTDEDRDSQ